MIKDVYIYEPYPTKTTSTTDASFGITPAC